MTDLEIEKYLKDNNYEIFGRDYVSKISNESPQIRNSEYDMDNRTMTLYTDKNTFTFTIKVNML